MSFHVSRWLLLGALLQATPLLLAQNAANTTPPEPAPLALADAVRMALASNPDLQAAAARAEAATSLGGQAGRWSNPALEIRAEDWPVGQGRGISSAKQLVGISQTFPFPGKKSSERRAGLAGARWSSEQWALRRTEVVRDVQAAFSRVLANQAMTAVSDRLVHMAEAAARTARQRVEAGAAPFQEQLRAEVQQEQARNQLAERQREANIAGQELARLLGLSNGIPPRLTGTLPNAAAPELLHPPDEIWLTRHPRWIAAKHQEQQAESEARRSRLEKYPDVNLSLAGGRIGASEESIVQLGVSIPLPLLDRNQGRERAAESLREATRHETLSVQQQLRREWAIGQSRYQTALAQVTRYREQILPKAEEALRLVQTGFQEGKFSFIDLLDTQRTDAEAQLAYQEKLLEMSLAQAELEALLHPQNAPDSHLP